MKTKLLKKFRRDYRIIKNKNNQFSVEHKKWQFLFIPVKMWDDYHNGMIYPSYRQSFDEAFDHLYSNFRDDWKKYSLKYKKNIQRENSWEKVWYNK